MKNILFMLTLVTISTAHAVKKEDIPLFEAKTPTDVDTALAQGAHINALSDGLYETPLIFAVRANNYAVAERLLQKGANVNHVGGSNGETALSIAVGKMNAEIAKLLLRHGANREELSSILADTFFSNADARNKFEQFVNSLKTRAPEAPSAATTSVLGAHTSPRMPSPHSPVIQALAAVHACGGAAASSLGLNL